jgi:thiamine biosynthesis lipoprotein
VKRLLSVLCAIILFSACSPKAQGEVSRSDFVLGTVCSVRLIEGGSSSTLQAIFNRLAQIEERMSANRDDTQIAAINLAAGKAPVEVSDDTFYVIQKALEYARLTGGVFDPSVGPLVKLWNIGTDYAKVPSAKDIKDRLALINFKDIELDAGKKTVLLRKPGMSIDLGAIAKGYSADEIVKILASHKVKAAVVDLGGNVLVYGQKKDGSPWRVGVQDPASDRGDYIGLVSGKAMTVVTSGIYERYFIENGVRYHHILDTRTGYPADKGLVSVTIIAASSIDADALSTSVFALGLENGMKLVKSLPEIRAIFIDDKRNVYLSPGAESIFSLTNKSYKLAETNF